MGTAMKHPVSDRVKPSFAIFDIRALWRSALSLTRSGIGRYSCIHIVTVGVKRLTNNCSVRSSAFNLVLLAVTDRPGRQSGEDGKNGGEI